MQKEMVQNQCDLCKKTDNSGISHTWFAGITGDINVTQEQIGAQIKTTTETQYHSFVQLTTNLCVPCYFKLLKKQKISHTLGWIVAIPVFFFVFFRPIFILHQKILDLPDFKIVIWAMIFIVKHKPPTFCNGMLRMYITFPF